VTDDKEGTARDAAPWMGAFEGGVPLPIELIEFSAERMGRKVKVSWATYSEVNNDYFTVERTLDNLEWNVVDTVTGAGNSTERIDYSILDLNTHSTLTYYRLKQTDYDGKFTYSNIVSVDENQLNQSAIVSPNPNDGLNFQIQGLLVNELFEVMIVNSSGQIVFTNTYESKNGSITLLLPDKLKSGIYTLILYGEDTIPITFSVK